jgi:hypothetical protein
MTRLDWFWLLAVGVCSSMVCVATARHNGATFDEPFYIAAGLESWRTGSNKVLLRAGTMPLPVDVQTLPLHVWERWRGERFEPVSDLPKLLPVARATNLVFWWLLLGYTWQLARLWSGAWAGRTVVVLIGFEPNLLAHAGLATTDIALTAGVLAAVFHFAVGRGGRWPTRVLIPGVAAGLAIACKASAITFVPLGWAVVAFTRNLTPQPPALGGNETGRLGFRDFFLTALVAAIVLFGYCGCDWAVEPSFVRWAAGLPDGPFTPAVRSLAHHLTIFPNAGEGIVQQIKHNIRGHGCYVLGEWHPRAVWYYFPVVLSAKLTEPVLILMAGLLLVCPHRLRTPAFGIAFAYLMFSFTCRVQLGIRLIFPFVAFLNLGIACAVFPVTCAGNAPGASQLFSTKWRWHAILYVLLNLGIAINLLSVGLRYRNRFWGESTPAAETLTDSNYDWGQGLPELAEWHSQQGVKKLFVWYYGTDPSILLPPFRVLPIHHMEEPSAERVRQQVGSGYLAVSASMWTSCPDRRPETQAVIHWLKSLEPVAVLGTFTVYRMP